VKNYITHWHKIHACLPLGLPLKRIYLEGQAELVYRYYKYPFMTLLNLHAIMIEPLVIGLLHVWQFAIYIHCYDNV